MRKVFLGLAVFLFVAVSIPSVVLAQDDSVDTTSDVVVTEDEETTDAEREARVSAIKERIDEKLSKKEEDRISGLCKAAQIIVTRLQANLDKTAERRSATYATVSEKLGSLVERLKKTSADTTELEAAILESESQIADIISSISEYKITISDLAAMECEGDPAGFKSVLTEVRAIRTTLVTQSKTHRKFITEDIKAILEDIKAQIKAANEPTEEGVE